MGKKKQLQRSIRAGEVVVTAALVTMGYYLHCYFSVTIFVGTLIFPSVCGSVSHEVPSMERAGIKGCLGHRNKLDTPQYCQNEHNEIEFQNDSRRSVRDGTVRHPLKTQTDTHNSDKWY